MPKNILTPDPFGWGRGGRGLQKQKENNESGKNARNDRSDKLDPSPKMSTGELADQLFDLVDANKDGKVSISEFNKFMEALGRAETQYEDWTKLCGLEETKCDPAFGIPKDKWNPWMAKETEEELKIQTKKHLENVISNGKCFRSFEEQLFLPHEQVVKFLKSHSRAISLHLSNDAILEQAEHKVIFTENDA